MRILQKVFVVAFIPTVVAAIGLLALLYQCRDVLQLERQILAGSMFILLAALVLGWLGYRVLRRVVSAPVQRLIEAHSALAQGVRSVRLESQGQDEFAAVAVSFNLMAEQLERSEEQLRLHEEAHAAVAANIPGVVFRFFVRPDGTRGILFVGERSQEITGLAATPYETFFERFLERLVPEHRESFTVSIEDAIRERRPWAFEGAILLPAGEKRWFHAQSQPTVVGEELFFDGVFLDITERREAEEALRESEDRFRNIMEQSTFSMMVLSPEGTVLYVNQANLRLWGVSRELACSYDILADAQLEDLGLMPLVRRAMSGETVYLPAVSYDLSATLGEGACKAVLGHFYPIRDANGGLRYIILIHQDVTEHKKAEDALRASEEKYRLLVENTHDIIYSLTEDGVFRFVSPAWTRLLGHPVAAVEGRPFMEFVHPDDLPACLALLKTVVETGERQGGAQYRVRHVDGTWRWHTSNAGPSRDASGVVTHYDGIARDITAQKRAEEALRRSETSLRAIMANTDDIIVSYDLDRRMVAYNRACSETFRRLLGVEIHPGFRPIDIMPEAEGKFWAANVERVLAGESFSFEYELTSAESRGLVFESSYRPIRQGAEIVGFMTTARDITERKRAEAALQRSESQLASAVKIAKLGHWELDAESGTFTFTDSFYDIFHTTAEEIGGYEMPMDEYAARFVHPEDAALVAEETRKAVETDAADFSHYLEHRIRYADGGTGHVAVRFFVVKNQQGKTVKTCGVNQDITEFKQAEAEREKLHAQLVQAQKMESVGRLAGGVAHDFNNMLGVILGHTELALEQIGPDEPLRADLDEIRKAAERSANLTRQLLAFARKQTVAPEAIDLNEAVEDMLKMLKRLIGEDIRLVWLPGAELNAVYMDPSQIDQILANLSVNARDAIAGTGKLTIETSNAVFDEDYCAQHAGFVPGEFVLLAMSDDGCGMDQEVLVNVFEPFFTTKQLGRGTGLGLATVHGIVKQNNGFINVSSEPGHGTTFRIYLPRHRSATEPAPERAPGTAVEPGNETILLVEDEPAILRMASMILNRLGYAVLKAVTPDEAMRLAREYTGQIDLVMTDVVMPQMNGRDLVANLMSLRPDTKCLFMSGYTADVIAHQGVLDKGVHFIQKPFSMNELATKVREALGNE